VVQVQDMKRTREERWALRGERDERREVRG
jgi:hypothetical protein